MTVFDVVICLIVGMYYTTLLVTMCGLYWLIKRQRWRFFTVLGTIWLLMLIPGYLTNILPGSTIVNDVIESRRLTGTSFLMGSPIAHYESEVAFNGDGYSIYIFRISPATAKYFQNPPNDFFNSYPRRPWYRHDWGTHHWTRIPLTAEEQEYVEFGLDGDLGNPKCELAVAEARRLLAEKGTCVSYFHKATANIDLFILSPTSGRMVMINFNT